MSNYEIMGKIISLSCRKQTIPIVCVLCTVVCRYNNFAVNTKAPLKNSGLIKLHKIVTKSNNSSSGHADKHFWQFWWLRMQCFRRSRKCFDQSEPSVAILGFESLQKVTTLLQNPQGNICGNACSGSEEEVENVRGF